MAGQPPNRLWLAADSAITPGLPAPLLYLHTVSPLSDAATVNLLLADYAAADPTGKLNIIGGGVAMVGRLPNAPATAPFFLGVFLSAPAAYYGAECLVEIRLEDKAGNLVSLPGASPDLPTTPLVISQTPKFTVPTPPPHLRLPDRGLKDYLHGRVQLIVAFPAGLPLNAGEGYSWSVRVDEQARHDWTLEFVVLEQAPAQPS